MAVVKDCHHCDQYALMEDCDECQEWDVVCEYCGYCHHDQHFTK